MNQTKKKSTLSSSFLNTKKKIIIACAILAVAIILVAVLMTLENNKGQLTIKNKTDLKLEYVKAYYVYSEGKVNDGIEAKDLEAKGTVKFDMEPINFIYAEANLEVVFKFENYDELFVDAGYFHDNFTGNTSITFEKTADPEIINLKVKASNGILSNRNIKCNEKYTINLSEGSIPD